MFPLLLKNYIPTSFVMLFIRSDLNKLPYLNQCVKESMRLYPPVHAVARCLERDTVFSHQFDGGKKIALKKGTNVIVNIYVTHRNPSIWENPEVRTI